jgi:archaellum component FlaC
METLTLLGDKVDLLVKRHAELEKENLRLRATIEGQNKAIQRLNKKVATLDNGMGSVHLGHADISDEEKDNMRRQLDGVIAEIDKILTTLND